jgi:glycine/D-amino acid oxidase-like deaminating enzyme
MCILQPNRAPLLQSIWFYGTSYIIPNIDTVVCGGTAQKDDWNTIVSEEDTVTIMTDIAELIPSLAKAPVVR